VACCIVGAGPAVSTRAVATGACRRSRAITGTHPLFFGRRKAGAVREPARGQAPGSVHSLHAQKLEEGLEQEFNSVDAPRAAGEAYVARQSHATRPLRSGPNAGIAGRFAGLLDVSPSQGGSPEPRCSHGR
jgi:hypothetical protein